MWGSGKLESGLSQEDGREGAVRLKEGGEGEGQSDSVCGFAGDGADR